ncbi:MAG: hypothetical protein ACFCUH_04135 [Flavobacteriales bacterium]
MKRILSLILILGAAQLFGQEAPKSLKPEKRSAVTVGILKGGGSLVGADFEFLLTDRMGLQVGAGLVGFGAGLNFHFHPSIRSSFVSFQYWNQGIGDSFAQSAFGPGLVYRGRKGLSAQIGFAVPLREGPVLPREFAQRHLMLTYALGIYLPLF